MNNLTVFIIIFGTTVTLLESCHGFDDTYDKKVRPKEGGPPVGLELGIYVESLGAITASKMDFTLTMYFREKWDDPRLTFNGTEDRIYVGDASNFVWVPDLFFRFEKKSNLHDITMKNVLLRVKPNGTVFRSLRLTVTTACYMDLHRFPFDEQNCSLEIMSYSYPTNHLKIFIADKGVEIEEDVIIPSFKLVRIYTHNLVFNLITGNYSQAVVVFRLQRRMQAFLLTVYIPSILLVTVAWLSFWIDVQAAPARVALGITTVLTITTMTSGIQETLPLVTYATAIDVWLAACLVFVFIALLEYALANYLLMKQKKKSPEEKSSQDPDPPGPSNDQMETSLTSGKGNENGQQYQTESHPTSRPSEVSLQLKSPPKLKGDTEWTSGRLDRLCRFVYPALFLLFNLIYWPVYAL